MTSVGPINLVFHDSIRNILWTSSLTFKTLVRERFKEEFKLYWRSLKSKKPRTTKGVEVKWFICNEVNCQVES